MKTIETSIIFPFTLVVLVSVILLSFSLHNMILYKSAAYKYLVCTSPNSYDYNTDTENNIDLLKKYINKFSLVNDSPDICQDEYSIYIQSPEYNCTISYSYYDNCDLLRKCSVAAEFIDKLTQ